MQLNTVRPIAEAAVRACRACRGSGQVYALATYNAALPVASVPLACPMCGGMGCVSEDDDLAIRLAVWTLAGNDPREFPG